MSLSFYTLNSLLSLLHRVFVDFAVFHDDTDSITAITWWSVKPFFIATYDDYIFKWYLVFFLHFWIA
jgi:hypothetical protein